MRRSRHARAFALAVFALAGVAALVACNSDLVDDGKFRSWCGDFLCAWTVDEGTIARVDLPAPHDVGVELGPSPTTLSQRTNVANIACLSFRTIADIGPDADVSLGVDFNGDGSIEFEQPLQVTDFQESRILVSAPPTYSGIRMAISKRGTGRAVLAEFHAEASNDCTAPGVLLRNQALGVRCSTPDECRSGVCCNSVCAECCNTNGCGDAGGCISVATATNGPGFGSYPIFQCSPQQRNRRAGLECVSGDDCVSGACDGTVEWSFNPNVDASISATLFCDSSLGGTNCPIVVAHGGLCR